MQAQKLRGSGQGEEGANTAYLAFQGPLFVMESDIDYLKFCVAIVLSKY